MKTIFVSFAIEDERLRDFLKGQSLHTRSPFQYIDMSVKEAYEADWQNKVRTRIRRSDGLIALITKNSPASTGQKWEIACAKEEGVPILALWGYKEDYARLAGVTPVAWTWQAIENFIDSI
jgi:MTH538 TIR-like domain (DUF1863).